MSNTSMHPNDQCWFIQKPSVRCPERAEYSVRNLVDGVQVCADHQRWAHNYVDSRANIDHDGPSRADLLHGEDWPSGFPGLWTTTQAADHWGVKPATYRDYISAGYAPSPVQMRDPRTGAKLHDAGAVRDAFAKRPGRGARTDLNQASDSAQWQKGPHQAQPIGGGCRGELGGATSSRREGWAAGRTTRAGQPV